MKFKIVSTSSSPLSIEYYNLLINNNFSIGRRIDGEAFIELNDVDEMARLIQVLDEDIIIHDDDIPTIEIYDTWREVF